jgi:hypothetical protein
LEGHAALSGGADRGCLGKSATLAPPSGRVF